MTDREGRLGDTLPGEITGEGDMPIMTCDWCGNERAIALARSVSEGRLDVEDAIQGAFVCGECGKRSAFTLRGQAIVFRPGKLFIEDIGAQVPVLVVELVQEAAFCFYGASNRGAVAMCRAAVEEALKTQGCKGNDLNALIVDAEKRGVLGDEQVSHAHAARLAGNATIHKGRVVSPSEAMLAISAAVTLVNHIAQQPPMPARK